MLADATDPFERVCLTLGKGDILGLVLSTVENVQLLLNSTVVVNT